MCGGKGSSRVKRCVKLICFVFALFQLSKKEGEKESSNLLWKLTAAGSCKSHPGIIPSAFRRKIAESSKSVSLGEGPSANFNCFLLGFEEKWKYEEKSLNCVCRTLLSETCISCHSVGVSLRWQNASFELLHKKCLSEEEKHWSLLLVK